MLMQLALTDPVVISDRPNEGKRNPLNALGLPNNSSVSLGDGGSIALQFIDNKPTGNGNTSFDLWIFEVVPDVEDTFVDISKDGLSWNSVGKVFGSTAGIDIDFYGFGIADEFGFIRLTDDPDEGEQGSASNSVGADIDAVGAISTKLTPPETSSVPGPLPVLGAAAAFGYSRKLRKRIKSRQLPVAGAID